MQRRIRRRVIFIGHTLLTGMVTLAILGQPYLYWDYNRGFYDIALFTLAVLWLLHAMYLAYHQWVEWAVRREVEKERVYRAYLRAQQTWQPYPDATAPYDHLADRDDNPVDLDDLVYGDEDRKRKRAT